MQVWLHYIQCIYIYMMEWTSSTSTNIKLLTRKRKRSSHGKDHRMYVMDSYRQWHLHNTKGVINDLSVRTVKGLTL